MIGSGIVAFVFGTSAIGLARGQLHINCGMGTPGSEGAGTWTCSDGIGYLGVVAVLGVMWLLVVLVGSLVSLLVRHDRAARLFLVLLAFVSTVWVLGWTLYGSSELVQDENAPMTGVEYWALAVGPAAVASILGLAAGLLSLALSGRLSRAVGIAATLGLIIAIVLQPGLSFNIIPAAGLVAASVFRGAGNGSTNRPAAL